MNCIQVKFFWIDMEYCFEVFCEIKINLQWRDVIYFWKRWYGQQAHFLLKSYPVWKNFILINANDLRRNPTSRLNMRWDCILKHWKVWLIGKPRQLRVHKASNPFKCTRSPLCSCFSSSGFSSFHVRRESWIKGRRKKVNVCLTSCHFCKVVRTFAVIQFGVSLWREVRLQVLRRLWSVQSGNRSRWVRYNTGNVSEEEEEEEEEELQTMAASTELRIDQLPSDPLLHILSFLGFRDLIQYVPDIRSLLHALQKTTEIYVCFEKQK